MTPAIVKPEEVPEPKTPPVSKPKAKSRPLTEEQKAIAEENLAQKAQDMIREVDKAKLTEAKKATAEFKSARAAEKRGIETLTSEEEAAEKYRRIQEARVTRERESDASASSAKKYLWACPEYLCDSQCWVGGWVFVFALWHPVASILQDCLGMNCHSVVFACRSIVFSHWPVALRSYPCISSALALQSFEKRFPDLL